MKGTEGGMQGGQWRMEQEIGSGAFGIVTLWKNQVTHEKFVIKQCKQKLDSKSHARWLEEITLMNTMRHKNLVSGRQIPKEIVNIMKDPEDLLGLEFCDNDLRKVLSGPSHCCGLKEKNVLNMLRDVSCGMRFLHEDMHIIHRDLKPENILLSHRDNETVYKITDLGYAKRIDVNSICMSFVGTLQYLAPELYDHESGYSYTADYWSFGTVMFECITGERPFLLTEKAFDWYKCIQGKKDEEIWGCFEENVGTKFFTELPTPNQLCTPVLSVFKDWLQLVLRQNPRKRGKNSNGVIECFSRAESILQLKIIHVFDMLSCKHIAYDSQPGQIGSNLKFFLEKELNFPKDDQLLIFAASGNTLEDDHLLVQTDMQKDTIYLFSKNKRAKYSINMMIPEKVREILVSPDELFSYSKLKKAYAHSLFYCRSAVHAYKSLLRGLRALMISMKSRNRSLQCLKEELSRTTMKLETIIDVYTRSCNSDINYLRQSKNMDVEVYTKEWDPMLKEIQSFSKFTDMKGYMKDIHSIQEKCSVLQKSPIVGIQQSETELDQLAQQAEMFYTRLRGVEKDCTNKLLSSEKMSAVVKNCINNTESLFKVFSDHLICVMKSYDEIGSLNSAIEKEISNLKVKYNFIMERQLYRQGSLWRRLSIKESPPMPSLQCDSNLLSSLQGELMTDINEIPCDGYAEGMINDMSNNFERLRKLTKDEPEGTGISGVGLTSPEILITTTSITTSIRSHRTWHSLDIPSTCETNQTSHYIASKPPERSSASASSGYPSDLYETYSHTNERLLSYNDPRLHLKVNGRRDRCEVLGVKNSCIAEVDQRKQHIDIPPPRQPEHRVFAPTATNIRYDSSDQPQIMVEAYRNEKIAACMYPQYYDACSHPSNQSSTYTYRHPVFQSGLTSYNSALRPAQGRYNNHTPRTILDVYESRNSPGGRCYESIPRFASYNLRIRETRDPRLSQNSDGVHVDTYQQPPPPMDADSHVRHYHRGSHTSDLDMDDAIPL